MHDSAPVSSSTPMPDATSRTWQCPGIPARRKLLTGVGVVVAAVVFFALALWQGASMLVSSIIGAVFIGGFVGYLGVIAPTPFTLRLDDAGITRTERARPPTTIAWERVARVKEETFKSGKSVSLAVYKRVGERGVHRAFVVYRDDVNGYETFHAALRAGIRTDTPWLRERVHE